MFRPVKWAPLIAGLCLACLYACAPSTEPPPEEAAAPIEEAQELDGLIGSVARLRAEHDLIALGAVIASSDGILDVAVDGMRAGDGTDPVQATDQWHLGSNTKALTALLYGKLVERGHAQWGAPIPTLFPELEDTIDPAWESITIEHLFAHRTGMKQLGGFWLNARRRDDRPVSEQRLIAAHDVLQAPPSKDPAEYDYNNLNYVVAGAAIENILKQQADLPETWEEAMQALLFDALSDPSHRTKFGYGPPPSGLEGHRSILGAFPTPVGRGRTADNPAILGPAGTLHASLSAHASLAAEFLKDDSAIVSADLRMHLFTPFPDQNATYAMGWGTYEHEVLGPLFQHSGSNGMWYSLIVVAPDLDRVVIVNTNSFSDRARKAANQIARTTLNGVAQRAEDQ